MDRWLKTGRLETRHDNRDDSTESCSEVPFHQTKTKEMMIEKGKSENMTATIYNWVFILLGMSRNLNRFVLYVTKVLANSSLKPSLLRRHIETKHPTHKDKPLEYFKRKLADIKKCSLSSFLTSNEDSKMALKASFRVSYRIARFRQAHTIAENLIGPCAKDIAKCMLGEKAAKKIELVPLSNNTVSHRINDLANYVENELLKRIKLNYFAIQLDESTDVTNAAVLLVYIRYLFTNIVQEDVLFAKPLKTYTTGEAIFDMINGYFEKNGISWSYCVGVCTDGAKSMTGKFSGFVAQVKKINEKIQWTHCCIHRQALVCKRIPAELSTTLSDAVKIVNFIKLHATNCRLFHTLCEDFGSFHISLLLHTEVRWLSRGKVLTRLFELKSEVQAFFIDHAFHLSLVFVFLYIRCSLAAKTCVFS
ncbi:zinc finger BED domain-containing protein 5-like [Stegodyphus dumicola]|uniref:zinc finger BED domain-containing protein 5-like n=1 Tax=Stegodyphus dumicola TaxID=202533 RepID=UPI0015A8AB9D|nr:zinc finger BED domain-containing protein 5-like [Stegodyphus dumicola]